MKRTYMILLIVILVLLTACFGYKVSKTNPLTIGDEIDLDKYLVKFTGAKTDKSYEEKDVVHIYFDFTNNSGETKPAGIALRINAFQNGVQLTAVNFIDDTDEYNRRTKEVRNGATISNVRQTYYIEDMSDITLEISEYIPLGKEPKPIDVVIPFPSK